jgi:hypothetical protein
VVLVAASLATFALAADLRAAPKTVCTITVNSPDEREVFRRSLPADDYRFVELVERGRPDWLASACHTGVRCDVLLISGHFDGGTEFYTDRLNQREFLSVDEMQRVSCSDSCPGLFSRLKEVYLFGCNTLNAEALTSASAEIARSLVRAGHSPADAERVAQLLNERYRESNRDRMRQVFKDVPLIYGFSSKAPLGQHAAPLLERYLQSANPREIGSGQVSPKLLGLFAPVSMTVTAGMTEADPDAAFRRDACRLADERLSATQKIGVVHELLGREMTEVRMLFVPLERYVTSLPAVERHSPDESRALAAIAQDRSARNRYLAFTRDTDEPAVRARMLAVARALGWLTQGELHSEYRRMIGDRLAGNAIGAADVDLVCSLNRNHELSGDLPHAPPVRADGAARAAILACLGSAEAHAQVLRALTSAHDDDVLIAQVYLRHRPLADAGELRAITARVASMKGVDAQMHALETLASYRLSDPESLDELMRLYPRARSVGVQRAIAGILIRADYQAIAKPEHVQALRTHRLKSPGGEDMIDVLIRRLQLSL